jgi:hypothetical protein
LTDILVDNVQSVSSSKGEHSSGSGPYTTGIVHHSFAAAIDSATSIKGMVRKFGSADAGNQREGLHREIRIESHILVEIGRDGACLFSLIAWIV